MNPPFDPFPKIARLSRDCVVTEKIDGTNGQIWISDDSTVIRAGSRSRWLTEANDNFGFFVWVAEHCDELITALGPGRHFGEWWGQGIQRNYGLTERRFSLFNTARWRCLRTDWGLRCVPVLYEGKFDTGRIEEVLETLAAYGSKAAPGFMRPEGIVVYHVAANVCFKKTLECDEGGKGQ